MPRYRPILAMSGFLLAAGMTSNPATAGPPPGFAAETWPGDWREAVGIVPVGDGRFVAWERGGIAWMVGPDGLASTEPLIDISDEVGAWWDHGLLGLAVDPAFADNGFVYLLYVVDRHHLLHAGTPDYDPTADEYNAATIARVTRYATTAESDHSVVDPTTRAVLIGESIDRGLPVLNQSHGVGALAFGEDGTLLLSMGDGASFYQPDTGGQVAGGWVNMALADGIIDSSQDVGSYRAQMIDSLSGKILRIDPATGDGVASNPWFDPKAPRAARSRVWTLGLRNPFRFSIMPGTGSVDPADGRPGHIFYGDVGFGWREEIGVIDGPGLNMGWPFFEGLDAYATFWSSDRIHPSILNPAAGDGCPTEMTFRELFFEEGEVHCNPCDPAWAEPIEWSGPGISRSYGGWTGDGYLAFTNAVDEWIDFEITVPDRRLRRYAIRYANANSVARPLELIVDGRLQSTLAIEPTGTWRDWRKEFFELSLTPGTHVLRIRKPNGGPVLVDRIDTPDLPFTPLPESLGFTHRRPILDWKHGTSETRVPMIDATGTASFEFMGSSDCPIAGEPFNGNCAVGGVLIVDQRWPAEWRGFIFGEHILGWLRTIRVDESGTPTEAATFMSGFGRVTSMTLDPVSGDLLLMKWEEGPVRISPPRPAEPGDLNGDGSIDGGDLGLQLADWGGPGAGDINGDGTVNGADLGALLAGFDAPLPPCPADLNDDRAVNAADMGLLLGAWGTTGPGDLDGNGTVGPADLGLLLGEWGACPE